MSRAVQQVLFWMVGLLGAACTLGVRGRGEPPHPPMGVYAQDLSQGKEGERRTHGENLYII